MEARRITELEQRQNALELVVRARLEEAASLMRTQLLEQDEQRGVLMADVSTQLKQALGGIEGLRDDLRRKETLESRIAQLTESRFELLSLEVRRLARAIADDGSEVPGLAEFETLQQRAKDSLRPEAPAPRRRRPSHPDLGDRAERVSLERVSLEIPPGAPQPLQQPPAAQTGSYPAAPQFVPPSIAAVPGILANDKVAAVRVLAALTALVVSLTAFAWVLRGAFGGH